MAHRVISADTVAIKPAAPTGTQEYFTDAAPGTLMPATWCNMVQDEIVFALSLLGITPDPADDTQLMQLLAASVSNVGGASNIFNPPAVTTPWRRAVIASEDSIAGRNNTGALSCVVAGSDNSWAREARTFVAASEGVQVNGETSAAIAVIGVGSGTPNDIIESTAVGSAAIACDVGLEIDSRNCFAAGSRTIQLKADRATAVGADNARVVADTSSAIASRDVWVGYSSTSTTCAIFATQGVSNVSQSRIGNTVDVECALIAATQDSVSPSTIDSSSCAIIACGDVQIGTSSPRSAAIGVGGGEIDGQESVLLAGNGNIIDLGADRATVIGGDSNTTSSTNCHTIGCSGSWNNGEEGTVLMAGLNVSSVLSAAANPYNVMGGVNVLPGAPLWRIDSTEGRFRGTLAATTGGLDYAEFFPNADGLRHGPGRLVSRVGRKVTLGQPGARPVGVVSTTPSFVGGDDDHGWASQHEVDEWGRPVYETVVMPSGREVRAMRRHPDYDPELAKAHTPRSQRPDEWTLVGLVGQVRVAVADGVQVDDFLACGHHGLGVAAEHETRLEVMAILSPYDAVRGCAIALVLVR